MQFFKGTKGIVTWEKAGYAGGDVFSELNDYIINTSRNSFTVDSASLIHKAYFKEPVSENSLIRQQAFKTAG